MVPMDHLGPMAYICRVVGELSCPRSSLIASRLRCVRVGWGMPWTPAGSETCRAPVRECAWENGARVASWSVPADFARCAGPRRKLTDRVAYAGAVESCFVDRRNQQSHGVVGVCGRVVGHMPVASVERIGKSARCLPGLPEKWKNDSVGCLAGVGQELAASHGGAAEDGTGESVVS